MRQYMNLIGKNAKKASLEKVNTSLKNKILKRYALLLDKEKDSIIEANTKDIKFALKKD
jgi:glutamate-5-semialdehyde dehydrogenase